jgi:hypothetical protein
MVQIWSQALLDADSMNRNAVNNNAMLWPNGVVPYVISSSYNSQGSILQNSISAKKLSDKFSCSNFGHISLYM